MEEYLRPALAYIDRWLAFQMRMSEQPGCTIAVAHGGDIVFERAYGHADLETGTALTPRHRMRAASHTKSFTAAGILKLREAGKLKLDDPVGATVPELHPEVAQATIGQLLSHSAGLGRDGKDSGQFQGRRPFLTTEELLADLQAPPPVAPNTRFKYSNNGYGLLGLVIEAVAGEPYAAWLKREIVDGAGLTETDIDMPGEDGVPVATGHSGKLLLGRRVGLPGDYATDAIAPAGGIVTTAKDLARFFAQLSPQAASSVLSVESRREMTRRHWRNENTSIERHYGLGTVSGTSHGWDWFGHTGGLQGFTSRTSMVPDRDLTVAILTNAIDGWSGQWVEGAIQILSTFASRDAPSETTADWEGRWWSIWGVVDLVPVKDRILVAIPAMWAPFADATEIEPTGPDTGRIAKCDGYNSFAEPVRRVRNDAGETDQLWLGPTQLKHEGEVADELSVMSSRP